MNDPARLTDRDLVHLSRSDNQRAFGELARRHWVRCLKVACFYLHNRFDAEDCVQTAFLKAWEHLDQFQDSNFSAWLGRIVVTECLMLMRVRRRIRFVYIDEPPSDSTAQPFELAEMGPDPEGALGRAQQIAVLRTEMKRISPFFRSVMLLRYVRGLPISDVANELGITVAATKARLVRARADLQERMTAHQHTKA